MSLIFSKFCEYGIQAILYLAQSPKDTPVLLREISNALHIPYHFLSKVLQTLAREGIVVSQKGAGGGFALGRDANTIMLIEVVHALDGRFFLEECMLGFPGCGDEHPCPVHNKWKKAKETINEILMKKSIMQLGKEMNPKLNYIASLKK